MILLLYSPADKENMAAFPNWNISTVLSRLSFNDMFLLMGNKK